LRESLSLERRETTGNGASPKQREKEVRRSSTRKKNCYLDSRGGKERGRVLGHETGGKVRLPGGKGSGGEKMIFEGGTFSTLANEGERGG